jgi:hypothetical protein
MPPARFEREAKARIRRRQQATRPEQSGERPASAPEEAGPTDGADRRGAAATTGWWSPRGFRGRRGAGEWRSRPLPSAFLRLPVCLPRVVAGRDALRCEWGWLVLWLAGEQERKEGKEVQVRDAINLIFF